MFGTVAHCKTQTGREAEFLAVARDWTTARGLATGQVAEYVFALKDRPSEYMVIGIFRDEEAYYANAADPETDRWYQRMRALLTEDPIWHDGAVEHQAMLAGI